MILRPLSDGGGGDGDDEAAFAFPFFAFAFAFAFALAQDGLLNGTSHQDSVTAHLESGIHLVVRDMRKMQ